MLKFAAPILFALVALAAPATADDEDGFYPYACHRVYVNVGPQPGTYVCPPKP